MSHFRAFAALTRPVFLLGGALLYALGAVLSPLPIDWAAYALGQALVTATQLSAQYANEYFDLEPDRLAGSQRTWLTGGSGVLPAGRLAPPVALVAAAIATVAAVILAVPAAAISLPAGLVGLAALTGGWMYSAPPARLVATPVGVTAASLIVALLTPLTGALLQGMVPLDRFLAATVPLIVMHHAMLLAFEKPDVAGDAASGKRTLSVRLGPSAARRLHAALLSVAGGALGLAVAGPLTFAEGGWALVLAPVGMLQVWSYSRSSGPVLATIAVGLFSATALLLLAGVA